MAKFILSYIYNSFQCVLLRFHIPDQSSQPFYNYPWQDFTLTTSCDNEVFTIFKNSLSSFCTVHHVPHFSSYFSIGNPTTAALTVVKYCIPDLAAISLGIGLASQMLLGTSVQHMARSNPDGGPGLTNYSGYTFLLVVLCNVPSYELGPQELVFPELELQILGINRVFINIFVVLDCIDQ